MLAAGIDSHMRPKPQIIACAVFVGRVEYKNQIIHGYGLEVSRYAADNYHVSSSYKLRYIPKILTCLEILTIAV